MSFDPQALMRQAQKLQEDIARTQSSSPTSGCRERPAAAA